MRLAQDHEAQNSIKHADSRFIVNCKPSMP